MEVREKTDQWKDFIGQKMVTTINNNELSKLALSYL